MKVTYLREYSREGSTIYVYELLEGERGQFNNDLIYERRENVLMCVDLQYADDVNFWTTSCHQPWTPGYINTDSNSFKVTIL